MSLIARSRLNPKPLLRLPIRPLHPIYQVNPSLLFPLPLTFKPSSQKRTMATSQPPNKRQRSGKDVPYELIYWPGIPGRGEHVRLVLEEAGVEYTDSAHIKDGMGLVTSQISTENLGDALNPPPLAPPILKHGDLLLSQTSNIVFYLGKRLGLMGEDGDEDAE